MKVIVATTAGFCRGVRDALEVTLEAIQKRTGDETIYTYGPLIHNRQVLAMLEEKGIREENDFSKFAGNKVVIRAHGIPPEDRQKLLQAGATILNATCKRVARVHAVIKRHARNGYHTVIVGDADHAEVIGLLGYADGLGTVINRPEQVDNLPADWNKVLLVAQTTQNEEVFEKICERFLKRYPGAVVNNTICGSTHERQAEVRQMCSSVDAMVIVGGHHSGNTLRLAEVARECSIPTYHVETEADLNQNEMARYSVVGISAGASTPNWIIRNVVQFLETVQTQPSGLRHKVKRILELLAFGNCYIALGAALLPMVVQALTGLEASLSNCGMAAFYAFAMHSLNIYLDRNAIQMNDPGRAAFYHQWRSAFTWVSAGAVGASLLLAMDEGVLTFLGLLILVLLGVSYAVPVILPQWSDNLSVLKIKDIPTSKTFSVPVAWATVTVLLPFLSHLGQSFLSLLYAFWIVFLIVLVRTILLDLLAVHGDRLVGKETLVVLVGEKKTSLFVIGTLVLLTVSLVAGAAGGLSSSFSYLMLPAVLIYAWDLGKCLQSRLKEYPIFEALIEAVVIGMGVMALMWNYAVGGP